MAHLLTLEQSGSVATITLNRPELHNAFNAELIARLHAACDTLRAEATARVVILRGAGPSFCAGADLNWMQASLNYSRAENLADAAALDAMLEALDTLPQALIGVIHGAALGGGVGLVACCDLAIAAEQARFGFTEARLGLIPAVIARFVVPRIGAGHARARFVSARRFAAAEALAIGLVHEVHPADRLEAAVERAVADVLHCGPQAISAAKALIRTIGALTPTEARAYTTAAIAAARTGAEGQEGLRAFLEKRAPAWVEPEPDSNPGA